MTMTGIVQGALEPTAAEIVQQEVDDFEAKLFQYVRATKSEVKIPVEHYFAPGVYMREMLLKAGTIAVGHRHKTEHFNILLEGTIRVVAGGVTRDLVGPQIIRSLAGEKKVGLAITDCRWLTIHPTEETDPEKIEEELVEKSTAFLEHQKLKLGVGT